MERLRHLGLSREKSRESLNKKANTLTNILVSPRKHLKRSKSKEWKENYELFKVTSCEDEVVPEIRKSKKKHRNPFQRAKSTTINREYPSYNDTVTPLTRDDIVTDIKSKRPRSLSTEMSDFIKENKDTPIHQTTAELVNKFEENIRRSQELKPVKPFVHSPIREEIKLEKEETMKETKKEPKEKVGFFQKYSSKVIKYSHKKLLFF